MKDSPEATSLFPETRWSVVLQVRGPGDEGAARRALAALCADYWYPLYAFARRRGSREEDAKDLTQGFFAVVLKKNLFASAQPQMGKLRTYLLKAFQHFLADAADYAQAQKRGGGVEILPLEDGVGERRYVCEPVDPMTPERFFEQKWALAVVATALAACVAHETKRGRGAQFRAFEPFLSSNHPGETNCAELGKKLGLSQAAVWQAIRRLRQRFLATLRQQIADTLSRPTEAEVEEELRALRAALRN